MLLRTAAFACLLAACNGSNTTDASPPVDAPAGTWCALGGTVQGAQIPDGFCIRRFAGADDHLASHSPVAEPRTLAFAPNGDLFVGSPENPGAGGGTGHAMGTIGGPAGILVLSDDNHDGIAEVHHFLTGVSDVHGIAVAPDAIYYTTTGGVWRTPYTTGQRDAQTSGGALVAQQVATIVGPGRWTHGLARSHGGTLYVSNAASGSAGTCPDPSSGQIQQVNPDGSSTNVAVGFRNPMYMRCHPTDEVCLATELGEDGGASFGAHEKLISIRPSTDYGYPCCTTTGQGPAGAMSCASVTTEEVQFALFDTPFGMDWERGVWPAPFRNVLCVAKHGSFYSNPSWQGAGVFCAPTDPNTHIPNGAFTAFVGGFGSTHQGTGQLFRAADIAFAPDGRMFIADDFANEIYWVAPLTLMAP